MHAVIRTYSGEGAVELFDRIGEAREEVEQLLRGVHGFVGYTLLRTPDGGATVTVCDDETGCHESVKIARDWVSTNAADIGAPRPTVTEGAVEMHLT